MAFWGQKYNLCCHKIGRLTTFQEPDKVLLGWIEAEYRLFQLLEEKLYQPTYTAGFANSNELISFANTILNRRKSRAGKSLEHHLGRIFRVSDIDFTTQAQTEGNKRPDFIFPNQDAYHDVNFRAENLVFLGAKTTCKDRWRQILNEADRIPHKYLFTLQKGISASQLREMISERVSLVVPDSHLHSFSSEFRPHILSLKSFIHKVRVIQASIPILKPQ